MALIENNFGPVGSFHGRDQTTNQNGVAVYSYITPDALTVVKTAGYFNALRDNVFQGDIVYVGSKQLTDDSADNEYTIIYFDSVPRSPLATNVTMDSKDINATS